MSPKLVLYLIDVISTIHDICVFLSMILTICNMLALVRINLPDEMLWNKEKLITKSLLKFSIPVQIICTIASIFIPSTELLPKLLGA